jgi:hypothetical protein
MDCTIIVKVYKGIFTGYIYTDYKHYVAVIINIILIHNCFSFADQ